MGSHGEFGRWFTVGNWLCDSDLVSPTGIEWVLAENDLLADSYSDLEASILDEKEGLETRVVITERAGRTKSVSYLCFPLISDER